MIILTEPDWRATMEEPAGAAWRTRGDGGRVKYRGLPVWITMPGRSRVLTASQVRDEGLKDLGA